MTAVGARAGRLGPVSHEDVRSGSRRCELGEVEWDKVVDEMRSRWLAARDKIDRHPRRKEHHQP
jgi:hypothetical protein